jgi:hypothetical protein
MSCSQADCPRRAKFSLVWPGKGRIAYCTRCYLKACSVLGTLGVAPESLDVQVVCELEANALIARLQVLDASLKEAFAKGDEKAVHAHVRELRAFIDELHDVLFPTNES